MEKFILRKLTIDDLDKQFNEYPIVARGTIEQLDKWAVNHKLVFVIERDQLFSGYFVDKSSGDCYLFDISQNCHN